jgi:hypothetical protein
VVASPSVKFLHVQVDRVSAESVDGQPENPVVTPGTSFDTPTKDWLVRNVTFVITISIPHPFFEGESFQGVMVTCPLYTCCQENYLLWQIRQPFEQ